ncbi:MAG: hypothetical protein WCR06_03715 [bacterium]
MNCCRQELTTRACDKFLIGRDGVIIGRFGSRTKPDDKELMADVEKALGAPM